MKVEGFDSSTKHHKICTQIARYIYVFLTILTTNDQHFPNATITE